MTPPVSNHLVLPRSLTERSIASRLAGVTQRHSRPDTEGFVDRKRRFGHNVETKTD
jgi:hypothetical protein